MKLSWTEIMDVNRTPVMLITGHTIVKLSSSFGCIHIFWTIFFFFCYLLDVFLLFQFQSYLTNQCGYLVLSWQDTIKFAHVCISSGKLFKYSCEFKHFTKYFKNMN